jgi:uncharacterized protein YbjT (DUF2867 family)
MPDHTPSTHTYVDKTVLVFGATGKQGGAVARALLHQGWNVRAIVRDKQSDRAQSLALAGIDLHEGEFSDAASVRAAMAGVHGVFSMQPNSGSAGSGITDLEEVRFGKEVADAALQAGVQHLVYSSASIISAGKTGLSNLDTKLEIEDHVRRLDIASTIIRPATFVDLFTLPGMGLAQGQFSFFLHPHQDFEAIAVEDIGTIVAQIFANPARYTGRTIEIAGDSLTGSELGDALSKASGRPITYQRFPDALLAANPALARNVELFDEGRASRTADLAALKREFGPLWSVADWLVGPGRASLETALAAGDQPMAMR